MVHILSFQQLQANRYKARIKTNNVPSNQMMNNTAFAPTLSTIGVVYL